MLKRTVSGFGAPTAFFAACGRWAPSGLGSSGSTSPTSSCEKARHVAAGHGFTNVRFEAAWIEELPFEDASFDVVISNGVINLSPAKHIVFEETARVLRPGGRLALSDIVSTWALKERTRRKVDLWAACIAGAIPRNTYLAEIEAAGLTLRETHANDYRFVSERARGACATYGVGSVSLLAA